eukprot:356587-Chlamydomonas_euryale.AAC.1
MGGRFGQEAALGSGEHGACLSCVYLQEASIALRAATPVARITCMLTAAAGGRSSHRCSHVTAVLTVRDRVSVAFWATTHSQKA